LNNWGKTKESAGAPRFRRK